MPGSDVDAVELLGHGSPADAVLHSRQGARRAIFGCIEIWYDRRRRHSTPGSVSPVRYVRQLGRPAARAA